jgi:mono/diheme cytochrome c family protein
MSRRFAFVAVVAVASFVSVGVIHAVQSDFGRPADTSEIDNWGIIIGPDGEGLPVGGATAAEGKAVYERRCARCHGVGGTEGPDARLVGGRGTLATSAAQKTVGSYWPTATTLWDYINRAMPFDQPGYLTTDEVYGAVAYVLYLNDIVGEQDRLDNATLADVAMPNRDGFVVDPRR